MRRDVKLGVDILTMNLCGTGRYIHLDRRGLRRMPPQHEHDKFVLPLRQHVGCKIAHAAPDSLIERCRLRPDESYVAVRRPVRADCRGHDGLYDRHSVQLQCGERAASLCSTMGQHQRRTIADVNQVAGLIHKGPPLQNRTGSTRTAETRPVPAGRSNRHPFQPHSCMPDKWDPASKRRQSTRRPSTPDGLAGSRRTDTQEPGRSCKGRSRCCRTQQYG